MNWWHYYKESIGTAILVLAVLIVIFVMVDTILSMDVVMVP